MRETNHVSRSTTESECNALLERITEVDFLQEVIHLAYKVDKISFICKDNPVVCDNSRAGKIASSMKSIARQRTSMLLISGVNKMLPEKESKLTL
jgi:hypothetical protein